MFQRIAPIFALTMLILGITCPETSEGFAVERLWEPYDPSPVDESCKLRLGTEDYQQLTKICDECSTLFNQKEMHGLCRGNCFNSEYFQGCLNILKPPTEVPVALNDLIDNILDDFLDPRSHENEEEE